LKPGITVSNTISAVAGYFLGVATADGFNGWALAGLTFGIAGIIGSACVANNVLDEKIDARMKRTKRREVVTGRVSKRAALVYSVLLGIVGFVLILTLPMY
jgi:protoheme IX farnesyltransferase